MKAIRNIFSLPFYMLLGVCDVLRLRRCAILMGWVAFYVSDGYKLWDDIHMDER
jgi:hypothetical protein